MAARQSVRLLIRARWIIPVVPERRIYEDCAIAIQGQEIIAITPWEQAQKQFNAEQTLTLDRHILMPGLINAHGHAAMNLLRGYADDQPLHTWLNEHIWPAESRHVSAEFVEDGTELAIAEMIRSGTTCFADMYFFPEEAAKVARRAHMRAQITFPILDFPTNWGDGPDQYFAKGLALHDDYRGDDLIRIGFGPHAPYTVADEHLKRVAVLAEELEAPIQIHLHETADEVRDSMDIYGKRPIERLAELGLLTPQTQCVHMTQVEDTDAVLLAEFGAHVIHCPQSNLKLASGFCPVAKLRAAGVNVALGTDGAASNNNLDMLEEMHTAALLAKAVAGDAAALSAHQALATATINGARALGIDQVTGSLEVGKSADIIALEVDAVSAQPIHDAASALVYNGRAARVTHSWVAGRALLLSGHLQTLNERDIIARARRWAEIIQNTPREAGAL
ncbi:TRZ/ATZ family hydrolase [Gilvimarinus algae]|uniref:5-methylthioadenosine/S-adenosylhomocysteine deaminase n=1 Tax=Gilvimarinus algae TaxID=3058037 RepID=A0ABT8TEP2_9GAMM|nr:TRZ/ATZ family hydrolase [Gilvimarinus sp. SDUM040014]MDO3382562.1 TRZ/ATZ family hydrolase [Gilvimarinus sp. SDUM040014]